MKAKDKKGYWLMKTEPDAFGIDHLMHDKTTSWTGVRNFQVRNFMRDNIKVGDMALIYHSSCKDIGVAGVGKITKAAYPDRTQFDSKDKHYDPTAKKENPRWFTVDVSFVKKFKEVVPLSYLRLNPKLSDMLILRKGSRLSITPIAERHFKEILSF